MTIRRLAALCLAALALAAAGPAAAEAGLSAEVLAAAEAVPDGGGYQSAWTGSGTPHAVAVNGFEVLPAGEGGSYCSGFTFAVAVGVAAEAGLLDDAEPARLRTFQKMWYGAVSADDADDDAERARIEDVRERQLQAALPWMGVGVAVEPADARPGDLVQFWRTRSGHSAVFSGWLLGDDGEPVGLRYRSSQRSTGGVGDAEERLRGAGGEVDPQRIYFGRLVRPAALDR